MWNTMGEVIGIFFGIIAVILIIIVGGTALMTLIASLFPGIAVLVGIAFLLFVFAGGSK